MTRITLFCSLLIALQGCHLFSSKNNKGDQITAVAAGKYLLADSLYKADPELDLDEDAFVLSDSANVYMVDDSTHIFRKVGIFHESDSIRVHVPMGRFMPFMNVYYSTAWHEKPAYIYGTDLGRKAWTDFDGDGRADQILYGYTDYDTSSFADVIGQHPMWLRFISAAGQRYELHDTGYSEININEVTDTSTIRFSKPTKVYYIDAGYPACGYAQYDIIIAFRNGKMHILHKDITSMDSGQGDFYEVGLPTELNRHTDTVYITQKLSLPYSEGDSTHWDSLVISTLDSSIAFPVGDSWKIKTFYKAPERVYK